MVGLRLNVLYGRGMGLAAVEEYAALCLDMGWHLQFLLDARSLPDLAPRLAPLRVLLVVDHIGHFPSAAGLQEPGFQTLLRLVRDGAWVKLSGAYRLSPAPPYEDTTQLARTLMTAAPGRCVWGSDWPNLSNWGPMPNVGDLLDLLADWVPDKARRRAVLVDNPARLYGF